MATALVMPSLWEGFCLPVVEAMANGCPVIASRAGSLPEIVGEAGILIDPQNSTSLADAMKRIVMDALLQKKLSHLGEKRAKQFSWFTMAEKVFEIINHL